MNVRQRTLNEVYEYLHNHCGLHTKSDFADILEVKRAGLYSAMNGNESYLTDNLFRRICTAYPGLFDIEYLLTGKGTLLLAKKDEVKEVPAQSSDIDPKDLLSGIQNLLEVSAQQIKENEAMRRDFQDTIKELHEIVSRLRDIHLVKSYTEPHQGNFGVSEPHKEYSK